MEKKFGIIVDTSSKKFMFNLGRLFAEGVTIQILNLKEVQKKILEEQKSGYAKSFNMMIKYWQDNNFSPNIFSNKEYKNNLFLICPVRKATIEEKERLQNTIVKYKDMGFNVHYPERDTNQNPIVNGKNTGGYNICLENATAIASANTVAIFYNKDSTGSMFDLGVTYQLLKNDKNRRFILENNDIELDPNNFIDNRISEMLNKKLQEKEITH